MSDKIKKTQRLEELTDKLFENAYTKLCDLSCTAYVTSEPLPFEEKENGRKIELAINGKWAEEVFDCAWFHITGKIPEDYDKNDLVFLINCGGEGLIYDLDGNPKQAITCYASDFDYTLGKPEKKVVLTDGLTDGDSIEFWIDCAANDLFGKMKNESRMELLCVAKKNEQTRALAYDLQVLTSVSDYTKDKEFSDLIVSTLTEAVAVYETVDESNAAEIRAKIAHLWDNKNTEEAFTYYAIGHAHLDLAWLWPIRESKRKGARTFTTQFMNIARYPDYIFGASQAQLYQWVKECYPDVYKKVQELAKTKNWDVQGATWVEMDSNLIGGESMIRQFFYGKKFFLEEFGQEMKIFWVPDSFGYSACIPQVMKLADVPYFLTQKMSWNTVNKFPYHTFNWQGLDGTQVFAHMLPDNTYNGPVRADFLDAGEKNYQERAISDKAMMLFGIGDGGAGPGFEHIERMHRLADLKGMPKVKPMKSLEFFKLLDDGTQYPTHKGELYLEKHQGTYTTQSKNKKYNRKCEFSLRNYELLAYLASAKGVAAPIGKDELDNIWREILLYQFHDILPGSSINRVYEESVARYEIIYARLNDAIAELSKALCKGKGWLNLTSYNYTKTLENDGKWYSVNVPAIGFAGVDSAEEITAFSATAGADFIENDKVKVTFKDGLIVSLFDKSLGKELIKAEAGANLFSMYTDVGDCWDIKPVDYQKDKTDAVCTAFETGVCGAKAYAKVAYKVCDTEVWQTISITDNSALVTFETKVNFVAKEQMLRAAFPVNIKTETAKFNIQFGHIERKTTENDSWDTAQYEVSGQKFVDFSQGDYGISLIDDCKYGYRCKGDVIDIDLIRAPKDGPGENVDQGENFITYALYPHAGELGTDTYREAYILNNPPIFVDGAGDTANGLYKSDNENIVLESVKIPEDKNGLLLRLYNASESAQSVTVGFEGRKVTETVNVPEKSLAPCDGSLTFNPFELKIVRIV